MWGKIIIPMYRWWLNGLYGLYGPRCPLFSKRPINLISLSLSPHCITYNAPQPISIEPTMSRPGWEFCPIGLVYWRRHWWIRHGIINWICTPPMLMYFRTRTQVNSLRPSDAYLRRWIIGSDNGLSLGRRQAIIWANAGMLLIGPLGTGFREMLIGIQIFSFTKMRMKMLSAKWRPFCPGLDVLTHYFRWLNAKEANPQCTEAASLVSFALSHPFYICHQLNITLYCASTTTAHTFPFRVASMPAVRYDLSGGLPTCLWLFIYQDYSVICISKKLM